MTPEKIKALLFEIGAKLHRTATYREFEALQAQFEELKNQWNELTNNAILSYEYCYEKSIDKRPD